MVEVTDGQCHVITGTTLAKLLNACIIVTTGSNYSWHTAYVYVYNMLLTLSPTQMPYLGADVEPYLSAHAVELNEGGEEEPKDKLLDSDVADSKQASQVAEALARSARELGEKDIPDDEPVLHQLCTQRSTHR